MAHVTGIKYTGTALPTNGTTVTLFSTVAAGWGQRYTQTLGFERLTLDLVCDHDGTLKFYKSADRGTNWLLLDSVSVTGAANTSTIADFLVEEYEDWKLDFTVGGTTETVFAPSMSLTSQRVPA